MKSDKIFLESILEEIEHIEDFMRGLSYEEFSKNIQIQYAVFKALENIGEAAKNISEKMKQQHPGIPWKDIGGMRDKLIHNYLGIRTSTVWKTVKEDIPKMKEQVIQILKELEI